MISNVLHHQQSAGSNVDHFTHTHTHTHTQTKLYFLCISPLA